MAYKLEITKPDGTVIVTHELDDSVVMSTLIYQFHVPRRQVEFALGIIHANAGTIFDLSIVEETDNNQQIVWTARLSQITPRVLQ